MLESSRLLGLSNIDDGSEKNIIETQDSTECQIHITKQFFFADPFKELSNTNFIETDVEIEL
jgi:hypothetical protein